MNTPLLNKGNTTNQNMALQQLLSNLQSHSPFYQQLLAKNGIDINDIKTVADLPKIPVTTKEDMQLNNWDFLCVDKASIVEYTSTSGTLGKPVTIALTGQDLDRLAYNEWCSFLQIGATAKDIFQLMLTLDRQFMAGIAYYSGIRKLGAGMVRVGPGAPAQQWEIVQRLQPTILVAVPSFLVKMVEYALDKKLDLKQCPVKKALCIGENIRNSDYSLNVLGKKITEQWDIELYSTYASTEMQTAFTECVAGQGGHLNSELLIVEFLDENNHPVAPGIPGEVTITTLGVEGMPLLRYKTGDVATYNNAPCLCGQQSLRISPIMGRKMQMIKLKGTTIYPPAIFELLNAMPEIEDYVVEVFANAFGLDEITLLLAPKALTAESDSAIKTRLQGSLRVIPELRYLPLNTIHQMQLADGGRKPRKFVDKR